jgi:hypothetical protein
MMRASAPVQLFGLIQDEGMTTLATPRSQTTSAGAVYHARLIMDVIMETWDSRYKAGIATVFDVKYAARYSPATPSDVSPSH